MTSDLSDNQQLLSESDLKQDTKAFPWWWWLGCMLFVAAAALHSATKVVGGGDTWVAMQNGRYTIGGDWAKDDPGRTLQMKFLDLFGIHMTQKDPFSAASRPLDPESTSIDSSFKRVGMIMDGIFGRSTKDGEPREYGPEVENFGWINQNWLTHVMFYKMKSWFGEEDKAVSKGEFFIVLYKLLQSMLTALFAYWAGRKLGAHPLAAAFFVGFGILLSRSYVDLRPNVSTIFFAAILIFILACWKKGHTKTLLWAIPVMILGSNVHGGFIYFIVIFWIVFFAHLLHVYAGKWNYFVVLGGMLAGLILLMTGMSTLNDMLEMFNQRLQASPGSKEISPLRDIVLHVRTLGVLSIIGFIGCIALLLIRFRAAFCDCYARLNKRNLWIIGIGAGVITLIPAVFSPFGFENLVHPFIVASGVEGDIWRNVVEWRPIWDGTGFGTVSFYLWFLLMFIFIFVIWWTLYLLKPLNRQPHQPRKKKSKTQQPTATAEIPWPKIDLAWLGIMAITLLMSIKSRRFVFLGGVVLAPFMAAMVQDIYYMACQLFKTNRVFSAWARMAGFYAGIVSFGAAGVMFVIFSLAMWNLYYKPHMDGEEKTVFRRMVGINDQPEQAMPFFDDNQLTGVVFNEWTNGGFLAFAQTPDEQTGEPACKVFMDGRSQAAYTVRHFLYWKTLNGLPQYRLRNSSEGIFNQIEAEAKKMGVSSSSLRFYDGLFLYVYQNRINPRSTVSEQRLDHYENLMRYALLKSPELYDDILKRENISVAVLTLGRSGSTLAPHFMSSSNWLQVYLDNTHVFFLRRDARENQEMLSTSPEDWVYPDDFSRNFSLGFLYVRDSRPEIAKKGLGYLMKIEDYAPRVFYEIYNTGVRLDMKPAVREHFLKLYDIFINNLEETPQLGSATDRESLGIICEQLARLTDGQESVNYRKQMQEYNEEAQRIVNDAKKQFLW